MIWNVRYDEQMLYDITVSSERRHVISGCLVNVGIWFDVCNRSSVWTYQLMTNFIDCSRTVSSPGRHLLLLSNEACSLLFWWNFKVFPIGSDIFPYLISFIHVNSHIVKQYVTHLHETSRMSAHSIFRYSRKCMGGGHISHSCIIVFSTSKIC